MKAVRNTVVEFLVLGMVGLVIAFAANSVRAKNSIKFGKNYFDIGLSATAPGETKSIGTPSPENPAAQNDTGESKKSKHLKHPYQEITCDEVLALLDDPNTETGLNVFIDARNDDYYNEGHIPGALQCDPYNMDLYMDHIIDYVSGAEKVVVYCGGGDCEDSIFMCRELMEMDVPFEAIYLFAGGWNEWSAHDGPVETGQYKE